MPARKIALRDGLAFVPLTKGFEAVFDIDDVSIVEGYNWHASVEKYAIYAVRTVVVDGVKCALGMHRAIMGAKTGELVDHRDRNGLNNQRSNLRIATREQNMWNRKTSRVSRGGLIGAHWDSDRNCWSSVIQVNGRVKKLGRFKTAEEAHQAYVAAARRLQGDFCVL